MKEKLRKLSVSIAAVSCKVLTACPQREYRFSQPNLDRFFFPLGRGITRLLLSKKMSTYQRRIVEFGNT